MSQAFTKTIELQMGENVIELQMTDKLISGVREAFGLTPEQEVTERHVKYFLASGMQRALEVVDAEDSS